MKETYTILFIASIIVLMESFQSPAGSAKLVLDAKARLGEGSVWHPTEKKLYWVDIEGKTLHIYDPVSRKDRVIATGERVGTVVPVKGGGVLVALQNGIHKMDIKTGKLTLVNNPIDSPNTRFNDGKCDPAGRFWAGTMELNSAKGAGVLYRLDTDKTIHLALNNVTVSNGIVWSADKKTMYFIDSPTSTVQAFDYDDETGEISNRRVCIRVPREEGFPDGVTIDAKGNLWIALWGGGAVGCWDPLSGELLQKITVAAPNTTSCAFGGKNLEILYITSAREGLSQKDLENFPLSGGVFAVKPGVHGVPAYFYKGKL